MFREKCAYGILEILRMGKSVLILDPTVAELGNGVSSQAKSGAGDGLLEGEAVTAGGGGIS